MAVAHLNNFLWKSMNSVNIYTPSGRFDWEIERIDYSIIILLL